MVSAHVVPLKGAVIDWVIQQCARDLERLGHHGQITLKSDQEAAIVDVLREIANLRGSPGTPAADTQSNGFIDRFMAEGKKDYHLISCVVLCCFVLFCFVWFCFVWYGIVYCILYLVSCILKIVFVYCNVLYCLVLYCIVLSCIVLYCMVWYGMVWYGMVWYGIVLYCIVLCLCACGGTDTEHRGNRDCARAGDLTGKSRGSSSVAVLSQACFSSNIIHSISAPRSFNDVCGVEENRSGDWAGVCGLHSIDRNNCGV